MDDADDPTAHDDTLRDLRRLVTRLDPIPEHVTAAAEAAFTWRTVNEELAALLHDSADTAEPAGTRARTRPRVLSFGADDAQMELEVSGDAAARVLMGQIVPPDRMRIEVRHSEGATTADVDERGRFTLRGIPRGAVSLRWEAPGLSGRRVLVTPWLAI